MWEVCVLYRWVCALAICGSAIGQTGSHKAPDHPRAEAFNYLSAAADFEVSQVVDRVKGVHVLIRKVDFQH